MDGNARVPPHILEWASVPSAGLGCAALLSNPRVRSQISDVRLERSSKGMLDIRSLT